MYNLKSINGRAIYGADVLTIINKAIDNNEEKNIQKDENGFYLENNKDSVKVELILLSKDEEGNQKEVVHQMETLQKVGLDEFISRFGLTSFECTNFEYSSQKRISKIYIKQLEI